MKSGTVGAQQSQSIARRQQELKELVRLSVGGTLPRKQRSKHSALSQPHELYTTQFNKFIFTIVYIDIKQWRHTG